MKKTSKFYVAFIGCMFFMQCTYREADAQSKEKPSNFSVDTTLDVNWIKSYLGRYDIEFTYGRILTFTLEGKQLYAQVTGQPKTLIHSSSQGEFYWKNVDDLDVKVQFVDDGKGVVDQLFFFLGTQKFHAKKMKDEVPVTVDPSIYNKYVGKYNLGEFMVIFSREGDNLYSQAMVPGGPKILLLPASNTEYFSIESSVRFKFSIDANGTTDAVIVYMNGQDMRGGKVKE